MLHTEEPSSIADAGNTVYDAPSRILVVAGEYNVSGIDRNPVTGQPQEQLLNVQSVYFYPTYPFKTQEQMIAKIQDTRAINNDGVALIKLRQPINGQCSALACLPTEFEVGNACAHYEECVITGWGFSTENFSDVQDELLLSRVRLSSSEACDFLTKRLGLSDFRPRGSACQSPRNQNTDSCLGDEGGPVLCAWGNHWVVRGILPFNLCASGRFNLYVTEIAPYLSWIKRTMTSYG
ncbi:serine protease 42-like [Aplysia californica]|uniref:Serine protease 42-like n=1 Tax=Aplysia californica TaxID=6500 RepID=A0ABM1W022_APLCA|nr:serine protease 42-like [Aplysia californica]